MGDVLVVRPVQFLRRCCPLAQDDERVFFFAVHAVDISEDQVDLAVRALPHNGGDLLLELLGCERFGDIGIDTGLEGSDDVLLARPGSKHENGQVFQFGGLAHLLHQFQAVHHRHIPVGQ